eukprot:GGOE01065142.1.p3 GENE.GGOE01065142.1~~GGOE01065142.1.p3  ORF type:complete len:182 (+),score=52.98 GGOE01065142.1:67-546(+)
MVKRKKAAKAEQPSASQQSVKEPPAALEGRTAAKPLKKRKLKGKRKVPSKTAANPAQGPSQDGPAIQPKTCMRCGEKGHIAKECKYANKIHPGVCHAWMRHGCKDAQCKFHHWKEYRGCFLELWRRQKAAAQAKDKSATQKLKKQLGKKKKKGKAGSKR